MGDGKLGLLCAQVLALTGCSLTLLGRHPEKGRWLEKHGIKFATSAEDVPSSADVVVEATGKPEAFPIASQLIRPQGTIVLKSTYHGHLSLNMSQIVVDEVSIIGSRCGPFPPAIRLLEHGTIQVEPLVQTHFSIKDGLSAFEHAGEGSSLKIMLKLD